MSKQEVTFKSQQRLFKAHICDIQNITRTRIMYVAIPQMVALLQHTEAAQRVIIAINAMF